MRVTAIQFKAIHSDPDASLRQLIPLVRQAAVDQHLVVLPEMAATGYIFAGIDDIRPLCEFPDGRTFQALSPIAKDAGCWIVAGFPETDGERLYNSALVIDAQGDLAFVYRKTLLFDADRPWAQPGDSGYRRFETDGGAFGVGICMDLNDDGFIEWCRGADLRAIAFPTNWLLEESVDVWTYWAWRLDGIPTALIAANSYGPDGNVVFGGRSIILDARTALAAAPLTGDHIIQAELR